MNQNIAIVCYFTFFRFLNSFFSRKFPSFISLSLVLSISLSEFATLFCVYLPFNTLRSVFIRAHLSINNTEPKKEEKKCIEFRVYDYCFVVAAFAFSLTLSCAYCPELFSRDCCWSIYSDADGILFSFRIRLLKSPLAESSVQIKACRHSSDPFSNTCSSAHTATLVSRWRRWRVLLEPRPTKLASGFLFLYVDV